MKIIEHKVGKELKNLEKVQTRLVKLCKYIENDNRYNDLHIKLSNVIGTIEEALDFDE